MRTGSHTLLEVSRLAASGVPKAKAYAQVCAKQSCRLQAVDLTVCASCYHFHSEPPIGCWLTITGDRRRCLQGSRHLAQMRLGQLSLCARQRRAAGCFPHQPQIGLLTPTLLFGGAERWVAALATGLGPAGCQIAGVAIRDVGATMPAIADKVSACCPIFEGESQFVQLAARCDVLIVWGLPNLTMLHGFIQRGGRVIIVSHGHCEWTTQCLQACAPYTTDWVAVSRHAALSFPDPARATIIHNGIDVDRCLPTRPRDEVRAAWGAGPDEILVGYVGRLSGEKRPIAAVEAAAALGPPYRAVLVGGGPSTDYWLAEARKIAPNVIYQPPIENVGDMYRALDCFVLASPSEGFSLALTEAWYCACPVVATPVGATELVEEHGPLYVEVPIGAPPEQLAIAVRQAVSPENHSIVTRAAQVVSERYTSEAMCQRWKEFLLK